MIAPAWRWVRSLVFVVQMYLAMALLALVFTPWAILDRAGRELAQIADAIRTALHFEPGERVPVSTSGGHTARMAPAASRRCTEQSVHDETPSSATSVRVSRQSAPAARPETRQTLRSITWDGRAYHGPSPPG